MALGRTAAHRLAVARDGAPHLARRRHRLQSEPVGSAAAGGTIPVAGARSAAARAALWRFAGRGLDRRLRRALVGRARSGPPAAGAADPAADRRPHAHADLRRVRRLVGGEGEPRRGQPALPAGEARAPDAPALRSADLAPAPGAGATRATGDAAGLACAGAP